jgi:hypothetical protein
MLDEHFIILGSLFNIAGSLTYALSTIRGRTKPNRVTWFLWTIAPLIAFSAQIGEGVTWTALTTFTAGFSPLLILLASFVNRKAYWRIGRLDIVCGAISVLALILWLATGTGTIAIIFSILADLLAAVPTLAKSFSDPASEHPAPFRNGAIGAGIALLTIDNWTFVNFGFALYLLIICIVLYALIRFRLGPRFLRKA